MTMQICVDSLTLDFFLYVFQLGMQMSKKGFKKGNTYGIQPAPEGSPGAKAAAPCEPFTSEQEHYVRSLQEFKKINHWFPYSAFVLPSESRHIATIAKVMMISQERHQRIINHPRLWHGHQGIVQHLNDLGFDNVTEENVEQRSVGDQKKMLWVNLFDHPTSCPKIVALQKNTRVGHWSRSISEKFRPEKFRPA
jgi:hypothetical protein